MLRELLDLGRTRLSSRPVTKAFCTATPRNAAFVLGTRFREADLIGACGALLCQAGFRASRPTIPARSCLRCWASNGAENRSKQISSLSRFSAPLLPQHPLTTERDCPSCDQIQPSLEVAIAKTLAALR